MKGFLYKSSCIVGTLTGATLLTVDEWKSESRNMFLLSAAPIVGGMVGALGGALPPLGLYWMVCYYYSEDSLGGGTGKRVKIPMRVGKIWMKI